MDSNKRIHLIVDIAKLMITILVSCGLVTAIVLGTSTEPMNAFFSFFIGPFTSFRRIGNIVEAAAPLMFTALAVILIFGAGQFSMIAEGSFFIGSSSYRNPFSSGFAGSGSHGRGRSLDSGPVKDEMAGIRSSNLPDAKLYYSVFCHLYG